MIRHLLRLICTASARTWWSATTEILLSFVVLFGVTTLGLFYVNNYRQPLGFRYDDVYRLGLPARRLVAHGEETANWLAHAIEYLPGVTGAAAVFTGPFESAGWTSSYLVDGRPFDYALNVVGDGFTREPWGSSC